MADNTASPLRGEAFFMAIAMKSLGNLVFFISSMKQVFSKVKNSPNRTAFDMI
jgi:hypothetical protein